MKRSSPRWPLVLAGAAGLVAIPVALGLLAPGEDPGPLDRPLPPRAEERPPRGGDPGGENGASAASGSAESSPEGLALEAARRPGADWKTDVVPHLRQLRSRGADGVPGWIRLLEESDDVRLRRVAALELAGHGGPEVVSALARTAGATDDPVLLRNVVESLGRLQDPAVVGVLLDLVASLADPNLRTAAARGLLTPGHRVADGARLVEIFLAEGHDGVRAILVEALADAAHPDAARRVLEALEDGTLAGDGSARALELLARLGQPVALEPILRRLRTGSPLVQAAAVDALASVAGSEAYPHLRGLYEGQSTADDVRLRAVWAMGRIGPGPPRDFLEALARDVDAASEPRRVALQALAAAGGAAYLALFRELAVADSPDALGQLAARLVETYERDR